MDMPRERAEIATDAPKLWRSDGVSEHKLKRNLQTERLLLQTVATREAPACAKFMHARRHFHTESIERKRRWLRGVCGFLAGFGAADMGSATGVCGAPAA